MICSSNDETNFQHELLLTNSQVTNIRKVFANNSSAIKLSKAQLSKMIQSGGFLGRLLGLLLKTGLPLMKNMIKTLPKSVSVPFKVFQKCFKSLGLTAASSLADAWIHKKVLGSDNTALIISNDEMEGITKIVKSLEDSSLLIKVVSETIQNEVKEQKVGFIRYNRC